MPTEFPDIPPWLAIKAFGRRDYARCVELARQSYSSGTIRPIELNLMLIGLLRLGRPQEAEQLGPEYLDLLQGHAWDQTLIRLILGQVAAEQALAQAASEEQRFQAHFYAGARALTEARVDEARKQFTAALGNGMHGYEFVLLGFDSDGLFGPAAGKPSSPSGQPSASPKPWWKFW
jgi:hypothetical protein